MESLEKHEKNSLHRLNQELMTNSMVNEVVRVMLSSPTLQGAVRSYFLGVTEITGIEKMALFKINRQNFSLEVEHAEKELKDTLKKIKLPLDFMSGEYPDAIFLNKHIVVDPVEREDPFHQVRVKSYVVMPIVSRITTKCWEVRNCGKTECPCYQGPDPHCWAVSGAALDTGAETEDEKRMACVNCSQFKCEAVVWLDTTDLENKISGASISHISGLNRHLGMVIESFNMYGKLALANRSLEDKNITLETLNQELNRKDQSIQRELDHARAIQKGLLPGTFQDGFYRDIASTYIPEGKVGGDYYDCFSLTEDLYGIVIADVSGHGIAAALIMSMFKVLLKTYSPVLKDPREVLLQINNTFLKETNSSNFVTVFYAIFNRSTRELMYCNAGHNPQLLLTGDKPIEELKSDGMFVGILDEIQLERRQLTLEEPTRLILFTDGIPETKNDRKEMYGQDRLVELAESTRYKPCQTVVKEMMASLEDYRGEAKIKDDVTLLVIDL